MMRTLLPQKNVTALEDEHGVYGNKIISKPARNISIVTPYKELTFGTTKTIPYTLPHLPNYPTFPTVH